VRYRCRLPQSHSILARVRHFVPSQSVEHIAVKIDWPLKAKREIVSDAVQRPIGSEVGVLDIVGLIDTFIISYYLGRTARRGFRRRTPDPPPFSLMNSMPAFSRAFRNSKIVRSWAASAPGWVSSRFTLGSETPEASARSRCSHRRRARAARTCSLVRDTLIPQVSHRAGTRSTKNEQKHRFGERRSYVRRQSGPAPQFPSIFKVR
jgi:hypothetical protein